MKIIIAPDSFKESLTALEVANAIEQGFKHVFPYAEFCKVPMADGGEGSVQSLVDATNGSLVEVEVTAPLGNKTTAFFGLSGDKQTAFIEMAAASGLHLVPFEQRNPLMTTTFGTGELINAALDYGVKKIILGIGGSATNDGGVGMLQAVGFSFKNAKGEEIGFGGGALNQIDTISLEKRDPRLTQVEFEVACDVDNPLCGERGAAAVFAPQKGATASMVTLLDNALAHFANIVRQKLDIEIADKAGAGAAGGMGAGLLLLPKVQLKAGVQIIIEATNLAEKIQNADLVITGEGRMDAQSIAGKTPIGVAKLAKQFGKPVIAIVGCLRDDYPVVYQHGIDAVFPIIKQLGSLEETLQSGKENLCSCAENVARLLALKLA
ncbi:Glycerate kinase [Bibersteinia trehalosi USDA-ARS-USMARC-188]|uniref:Glycerate kinase n=2 Tax=Bibersteinia trehalosi TaxID=47735 RepID=A0A4V7IBZ1_BIBTR|nr:glycerate kinase [Bibersteinia trehalosi]AGH37581.1 Glycerate kinase [Bibersteinia trehalosi USDA-ARS-USMARC-192]AHG82610.1 Glycerate kinase [Bibersteinia trehalosi USDA-ARS-USMARC-188]AHG84944.1 Glycerate kinase [Bibersteinia trehalosi USDA-ARS-USMARC-189]